jgi:hypothetical protein
MARGRPTILERRITTSISLSQDDMDFIKLSGKENSAFIRELIAEKRKSVESPIGKIRQEIAERKKHVEEELLLIQLLETRLREEEEKEATKQQEMRETEENEAKLREYIVGKFNFIANHQNPHVFLEHLVSGWGLPDIPTAKKYIFNTLVEAGHPAGKVKKIRMLEGI